MFSVSPEIYAVLSEGSRWLFAFFALVLFFFALSWHRSDRKERRERFRNLPGAGTVGELVVLSGSDELPPDTWFPVPREGVLGSLRSCDLVIPCPGVRSHHLDFSWQDGTGLVIRPRLGCEVTVDSVPVVRSGLSTPMVHGSVLQVGSAVLRLQLFAALSHTNRIFTPPVPLPAQKSGCCAQPVQGPVQYPPAAAGWQPQAWPVPDQLPSQQPQSWPVQEQMPAHRAAGPVNPGQAETAQPVQPAVQRRKRADYWKEDWSE